VSLFLSVSWGPLCPLDFSHLYIKSPRELTFLSTLQNNLGISAAVGEKFILYVWWLAGWAEALSLCGGVCGVPGEGSLGWFYQQLVPRADAFSPLT